MDDAGKMEGRRVPWPAERLPIEQEKFMEPGDYAGPWDRGRHTGTGMWLLRAPNGDLGTLTPSGHTVVEHDDDAITVSPSIQFETGARWHGYLKHGEWSQ